VTDFGKGRRELTSAQRGMWFAQLLDPGSPALNIALYAEIFGDIDTAAFAAAVRRTVGEHDGYHLRFDGPDRAPWRYLEFSADWPLPVVDLRAAADPHAAALAWMHADLGRPADLRSGNLFAVALLRVADDRWYWYHRCHHILGDAYSGRLMLARVALHYTALAADGRFADGQGRPAAVLDDADAAYRRSEQFSADREFWRQALAGRPAPASLSGRPAPAVPPRHVLRRTVSVDGARLRARARALRTSLSGLFITAAAGYVQRVTGATDLILGIPVNGRSGAAQRATPGMGSNILPVRFALHPADSIATAVQRVSGEVRKALRHRQYRYEDIVRDQRLAGDVFATLVNVISFGPPLAFAGHRARIHQLSPGTVRDLSLCALDEPVTGSLEITIYANPELYTPADVGRHIGRVRDLLDWLTGASADDRVGSASLIGQGERDAVVRAWHDTANQVPYRDYVATEPRAPLRQAELESDTGRTVPLYRGNRAAREFPAGTAEAVSGPADATPAAGPEAHRAGNPLEAAAPRRRPHEPGITSGPERVAVASAWNDTAREFPAGTVPGMFLSQAARTPGALALVCGGERLTYAQLRTRAARVAGLLAVRDADPGDLVGVVLPRTAALPATLLGVLMAGAAYVPVDPDYPPARIARILADARAKCAITTSALGPALPPGFPLIALDPGGTAAEQVTGHGIGAQGPARGPPAGRARCCRTTWPA